MTKQKFTFVGRPRQKVIDFLRHAARTVTKKFDHALLDLKKDQPSNILLPGHIKKTLDELNINCVIDVGANEGQYASMLRLIGYTGRIISIEPIQSVYTELSRQSSNDPSWNTLNFALGAKDDIKEFNICGASDMSSFLTPSLNAISNINDSDIVRTERVVVKRLDSIFEEVTQGIDEPCVYLKLDTQGYDLEVLKGSDHCISQVSGLQSELSVIPLYQDMPDYLDSLLFCRKLGFEPTGFFTVASDKKTRHILELDAVFTRRSFPEDGPFLSG